MNRNKVNENYFQIINSEEKAYFLGLIFADGSIYFRKGNYQPHFSITLIKHDKYLLEKLKYEIQFTGNLYYIKPPKQHQQNLFRLGVTSSAFCGHLINSGCIPNKSLTLEFPKIIPECFLRHFIRGYFDGDGSVHLSASGRHKNPQYHISILGTESFLNKLSEIVGTGSGIGIKKVKPKSLEGKIFRYMFGGNEMVKKFYHYLYDDSSVFMERKKEKMEKVFGLIPYRKEDY